MARALSQAAIAAAGAAIVCVGMGRMEISGSKGGVFAASTIELVVVWGCRVWSEAGVEPGPRSSADLANESCCASQSSKNNLDQGGLTNLLQTPPESIDAPLKSGRRKKKKRTRARTHTPMSWLLAQQNAAGGRFELAKPALASVPCGGPLPLHSHGCPPGVLARQRHSPTTALRIR